MTKQIALSLGSNIERDKHIRFALTELTQILGELIISPIYETQAVGFNGPDFYNLVVVANTELSLKTVLKRIHAIEVAAGCVRDKKNFASRNLDIDILLYGEDNLQDKGGNIPREEINHAAYVLKPLADVLPDVIHPVLGVSFAQMWREFSDASQVMGQIDFEFDDASLE